MNMSMILFEIVVALLGMAVLIADLWVPPSGKRRLAYGTAAIMACVLVFSLGELAPAHGTAFGGMFVIDSLASFIKPFFLLSAMIVIVMAAEFEDRLGSGLSEYCALTLFATCGMLIAASANDLMVMFVGLELITVTFYILNSFQRTKLASVESGIKYLILGAVASAFLVYGIALIFGAADTTQIDEIFARQKELAKSPLLLAGVVLVLVGLGFKIAAFPFQIWAPDVYQGAPPPAAAFLAAGSKTAGFILLLRLLYGAVPEVAQQWRVILMVMSVATIAYGSLCAIPQRSVKRLLGYSSIANAGFLLLGVAAGNREGIASILYYLASYIFAVLGAFAVISILLNDHENDDITSFSGLGQRSPILAAVLTLALASLAGIPPLAGFFGKFLVFRSLVIAGVGDSRYLWLLVVGVIGAVISLYYYFGIVRAMYWGKSAEEIRPLPVSVAARLALGICTAGMIFFGTLPGPALKMAVAASEVLTPSGVAIAAEHPHQLR